MFVLQGFLRGSCVAQGWLDAQCLTAFTPVMSFAHMPNAFATTSLTCQPQLRPGAGVAGISTTITTVTIRPVRPVVFA